MFTTASGPPSTSLRMRGQRPLEARKIPSLPTESADLEAEVGGAPGSSRRPRLPVTPLSDHTSSPL